MNDKAHFIYESALLSALLSTNSNFSNLAVPFLNLQKTISWLFSYNNWIGYGMIFCTVYIEFGILPITLVIAQLFKSLKWSLPNIGNGKWLLYYKDNLNSMTSQ